MHTKQDDWAEMLTGESGDGGPREVRLASPGFAGQIWQRGVESAHGRDDSDQRERDDGEDGAGPRLVLSSDWGVHVNSRDVRRRSGLVWSESRFACRLLPT